MKEVKGALVFIGDELLCGLVENLNASFALKKLFQEGFYVSEVSVLPDKVDVIINRLRQIAEENSFIIISGGIGPTDDDLTTLAVAKAFKLSFEADKKIAESILKRTSNQQEIAIKMAILPKGAKFIGEEKGCAGYVLELENCVIFCLPGVPEQFKELLKTKVIPFLKSKLPPRHLFYLKVVSFFGIEETALNKELRNFVSEELSAGFYPGLKGVKLVLKGKKERVEEVVTTLKEKFKESLVSEEGKSLEEVVGELLTKNNQKISVAESCTGGKLSSLFTSVSGSSAYFERGFVTYSPESKVELLGVKKETIEKKGIVSFEVAMEMAVGCRKVAKTDYGIGITGFAGPTGGTEDAPVGTVFIGISWKDKVGALRCWFCGNRHEVQEAASYTALDMLRRVILYDKGVFSYRFAQGYKERAF